jgi:AraC-like DNA-binding protein
MLVEQREPKLGRDPSTVTHNVFDGLDRYASAVAGIDLDIVPAGPSAGPTEVLAVTEDRFAFNWSKIGSPMLGQSFTEEASIAVACMRNTVPGSRWCEMSLEPGAVVVHSSGSPHTARNLAGTEFMFLTADRERYAAHADLLGVRFDPPPNGEIHLLPGTPKTSSVGPAFETFANHAATGEVPSTAIADAVMTAVTLALSEEVRAQRIGAARRIDGRRVVRSCIEHASSNGRIPSISELCLAAHVSERTLREAFIREYDVPPTQFFRAWALDQARYRLLHGESSALTVTEIATGLGFDHLGRFAGRYRQTYGESPSATLHHHG